jgi:hypothetical protein
MALTEERWRTVTGKATLDLGSPSLMRRYCPSDTQDGERGRHFAPGELRQGGKFGVHLNHRVAGAVAVAERTRVLEVHVAVVQADSAKSLSTWAWIAAAAAAGGVVCL